MTTKLSKDPEFWRKHPEQMLAYFPRPYLDAYRKVASELKLDPNVLMGISRQESSFRVDIKSVANAWGLMQVTPPTARRLLPAAGFPADQSIQIPEALLRPESNIRFGATFVRELMVRNPENQPAIFAAYNAGPLTVENWVARRIFDDPLMFIEMIPYQETRDYVKGVWRNELVYGYLAKEAP
jgi:soluble lytic murein transglycosylase